MSSNPFGKNKKAMWQNIVNNMLQRLHPDDAKGERLRETVQRIALQADYLIEEMEKRYPNSEVKVNPTGGYMPKVGPATITVKR